MPHVPMIPALYLRSETRAISALLLSALLLLLIGCGGGDSSSRDEPKMGDLPTASGPVYFLNQVGPSVDADFKREIALTEQQFTRDVNPRYGIDAHAVEYIGEPDPHKLTCILRPGPAMDFGDGRIGNTMIVGNWALIQYNETTINDGTYPARLNHGALDLAHFPLGQQYEAEDYSVDASGKVIQAKVDGKWWLCNWPIPLGTLDCNGNTGRADFLGNHKR